jgi:Spy/CpxP family protein refolding chaperone
MALCSIAVAVGIVGVVALVKRAFFRRRWMMGMTGGAPWGMAYAGGCGSGFGGHRPPEWGGSPPWSRGSRGAGSGPGGSFWLRAVFSKLDTTPGQEKEIRAAVEEVQREAREAKDELRASREGVARAVAGETFDEIAIGEASVKLDAATARVKNAMEASLRRIHAVLDARQRERLAELLERGPRPFGGPYRSGGIEI